MQLYFRLNNVDFNKKNNTFLIWNHSDIKYGDAHAKEKLNTLYFIYLFFSLEYMETRIGVKTMDFQRVFFVYTCTQLVIAI